MKFDKIAGAHVLAVVSVLPEPQRGRHARGKPAWVLLRLLSACNQPCAKCDTPVLMSLCLAKGGGEADSM